MFHRSIPEYIIENLKSEEKDKQLDALEQLKVRQAKNEEVLLLLQGILDDENKDNEIRAETFRCLVTILDESEALKLCVDSLGDPSAFVRRTALVELQELNVRKAYVHVLGMIENDPSPIVKMEAVKTLVELREERSLASLFKLLLSDQSGEIKDLATKQIQAISKKYSRYYVRFMVESEEINFSKLLLREEDFKDIILTTKKVIVQTIDEMITEDSIIAKKIISLFQQASQGYPKDKELHALNKELNEKWKKHVKEQKESVKEQLSYLDVNPDKLEVFAGAIEKIRLSFPEIQVTSVNISKKVGSIVKTTPELPVKTDELTLEIDFNPFQGQARELDAEILLEIQVEDSNVVVPAVFFVKIRGWEELEDYAKKLLQAYSESTGFFSSLSREDLVLDLGIPSFVIDAVYDYLNTNIEISIKDLPDREIKKLDKLTLELIDNEIYDISLYTALDVECQIMTIKKVISLIDQILEETDDLQALDASFLLPDEKRQYERASLQLLPFIHGKKIRLEEAAQFLQTGLYAAFQTLKYYRNYQQQDFTETNLALHVFGAMDKLDQIAKQYFTNQDYAEQMGISDYAHAMAYIDFNRHIMLIHDPDRINLTIDQFNAQTINGASKILFASWRSIRSVKDVIDLHVGSDLPNVTLFDMALATAMLLYPTIWKGSKYFTKMLKSEQNKIAAEKHLQTIFEVIQGTNWTLEQIFTETSLGILDVIRALRHYEQIQEVPLKGKPSSKVLNEVEEIIQDAPAVRLWNIFLERYATASKDEAILQDTYHALQYVMESMEISKIDIVSLPMEDRLKLNDQAVKTLKIMRDRRKHINSYLDLAREVDLTPLELTRTLSYAVSVDDLKGIYQKVTKDIDFDIESELDEIQQIELENIDKELKDFKLDQPMPELRLRRSRIKTKKLSFKKL